MTVIFWIIDKLGSLFSLVGIVCLIWLSEAVKAGVKQVIITKADAIDGKHGTIIR